MNGVILYGKYGSVGLNDLNSDVHRSKDIYSSFQADKYMYKK